MDDARGFRVEKDSMGEVLVPADALYGAQTARAAGNFQISGSTMPPALIHALGMIKAECARANAGLGLLDQALADSIAEASDEVADGRWDAEFPIDIFQTGSGTSTNMNANEVIARRASMLAGGRDVHPNDHVNLGQSSNDVIPSAIHASAAIALAGTLLPELDALRTSLERRAAECRGVIKTGRTHLMDAMPVRLGHVIGGWAAQIADASVRLQLTLPRIGRLALGGTAVGTGINAHPELAARVADLLTKRTGVRFTEAPNHFAAQSSMDNAAELSGQLKTLASSLMKIADDLRWMNSGPLAGLGEISLPALQPGSSIMPGKVNPVACEAAMMAAAQVIANDLAVTIGNERGNFELNTMLPLIARNLLESLRLLAGACSTLRRLAIDGFYVNEPRMREALDKNPILVTALNGVIGYDRAAEIAKRAYAEGRPIREVAREMTELSDSELARFLDPGGMA